MAKEQNEGSMSDDPAMGGQGGRMDGGGMMDDDAPMGDDASMGDDAPTGGGASNLGVDADDDGVSDGPGGGTGGQ